MKIKDLYGYIMGFLVIASCIGLLIYTFHGFWMISHSLIVESKKTNSIPLMINRCYRLNDSDPFDKPIDIKILKEEKGKDGLVYYQYYFLDNKGISSNSKDLLELGGIKEIKCIKNTITKK